MEKENIHPLIFFSLESTVKGDREKLLLGKGLNTVASTLNPFWKYILDTFSNLQNEKVVEGNDVLSQSI